MAGSILARSRRRLKIGWLSLGSSVACPICGWTGHAFALHHYPVKPAPVKLCPRCDSSERHRFSYLILKDRLPAYGESVLHFAPEPGVEKWLRSFAHTYLSVDIASPRAMRHMDITALDLPDQTFSLLFCSHVLEHIEDDRAAIRELFRVLKPGGLAVIMVPIRGATSYEDPTITAPEQRLQHFHQEDHVRFYGLDIVERLQAEGFSVETLSTGTLDPATVRHYGLSYPSTNEIFLASRP
jgi:SAM-dependent methyltransferase